MIIEEPKDVVVQDVRFWRESDEANQPGEMLPVKMIFTQDNINGILLFFETHGLIYSKEAVAQIRQEIETFGEANIWIVTHR
ncbi:hypothetical protein [Nitrospira sp.]|uniref:hypothetical protein n=1 Tax=Nitrospira sp. TaxID=70125 RepID=UPI003FCC868A